MERAGWATVLVRVNLDQQVTIPGRVPSTGDMERLQSLVKGAPGVKKPKFRVRASSK